MTLRWWLLALLSCAVAVSSLHLWRHRDRPRPVPVADAEAEENATALPAPRLAYEPPPAPRPVRKPAATGMAVVRGRVLGAPEPGQETDEELTLVVSDDENELEVSLTSDGGFAIELAPGTYRFHAKLDDMTATLDAVTVGADEERELVLELIGAVSIKGTLHWPREEEHDRDGSVEDLSARFAIRLSGEREWSESKDATIEDAQFTVAGLQAGKRYDLRLTFDGFRPVELTGIPAPSQGVSINPVRLARLRGGFGIARGDRCPINQVAIVVDDEEAQVALMDHFCRFQFSHLPPVQRVRVQVSEEEWQFDVLVDIPPHGDPPFLCLRSGCREPAPDELSTLEISVSDIPDKAYFASVTYEDTGVRARVTTGEVARFAELPSRTTAWVTVFARSCLTMTETLVLAPGINRLSMICEKRP